MSQADTFQLVCAALLIGTAMVHSILGERRLIRPLLAQRDGVLRSDLARFLLRGVWHAMSITFAIIAIVLATSALRWATPENALLLMTALGIGGAGIVDGIGSRGKHIGWPLLVAIGATALLALGLRP